MQEGNGVQSTKTAVTPQVALDVTRIGGTYQLTSIESNISSFLQDLLMHLMFQVIGRHSRKLCDLVLKMRICCIQKGLTLHAYQASSRRTLHHLQLIATTDSSTPVPSGVGYSSSVLFSLPLVGVNAQL